MISPLGNQSKRLLVIIMMLSLSVQTIMSCLVNKSFHSFSYFYCHVLLTHQSFIIDSNTWKIIKFDEFHFSSWHLESFLFCFSLVHLKCFQLGSWQKLQMIIQWCGTPRVHNFGTYYWKGRAVMCKICCDVYVSCQLVIVPSFQFSLIFRRVV